MLKILSGVIVVLLIAIGILWWRYDKVTSEFETYRINAEAKAQTAKEEASRIKKQNQTTLTEVSNAFWNSLPHVRKNAVSQYLAKYGDDCKRGGPVGVPSLPATGNGDSSPEDPALGDGGKQESVAVGSTCKPSDEFIGNCAEDARARQLIRELVFRNNWEIVDTGVP